MSDQQETHRSEASSGGGWQLDGIEWLTPRGTVTRVGGGGFDDATDELAATLAMAADQVRVAPAMVWTARRLVDLAEELTREEASALLLVVVATQVAQQRGSTRLAVPGRAASIEAELRQAVDAYEGSGDVGIGDVEAVWPEDAVARVASMFERGMPDVLVGEPGEYRPLLWDGDYLYHHQLHSYEVELVEACQRQLGKQLEVPESSVVEEALEGLRDAMPRLDDQESKSLALNPLQEAAVLTPVYEPLTLVTGGPGTGKTSIVMSLLRLMARLGVEAESMAVAAPTGKAANRLDEAIRADLRGIESLPVVDAELQTRLPQAKTLHRLLGYSPSRDAFRFGAHNHLDAELVVVDEASMVDLFMMRQLFSAVAPGTRLVLIGDADQLPAVENGAVFRDLIPDHEPVVRSTITQLVDGWENRSDSDSDMPVDFPTARSTVKLQRSYRVDQSEGGAQILHLADGIRRGEVGTEHLPQPVEIGQWPGQGSEGVFQIEYRDNGISQQILERWWEQFGAPHRAPGVEGVRAEDFIVHRDETSPDEGGRTLDASSRALLEELFEGHRRGKLLCVTRVFETGAEAINRWCHRRFASEVGRTLNWLAGEPVMMTQNDYALDLFNGDMGVVIFEREAGVERGRRKKVAFEGRDGYRLVDLNRVRDRLQRAYAMTIHKSQGSEFDHVGVVLPTSDHLDLPLLSREILYTGITRAKRAVTLFGDVDVLAAAAARGMQRDTGVRDGLRG